MTVHAPPKDEQERAARRSFMRRQLHQVLDRQPVTCACCEKDFEILHVYRCYYCGLYFCGDCAGQHFGKRRGA